ncbi:DUF4192 domain-containing protein [Agromyces sp. SYSU K20354]|uniref:DUF4192 family protein n=1 Tax=Agromyces cavernae TaxID=2898659 RepID=UPI001E4200F8|nr:DUF4192 family protein [Agromyces cavernae]MCD2443924.1 DUF4192 domain-containing protein [Agromyces cavernae]
MTTIIRAASAHDFLALVPSLAGFRPERSLVCVAFEGNRTVGVLRHDLPSKARDRAALVSVVVGTLCRMPGIDAVVPVLYTDRTFESERGTPERRLAEQLIRRAEQAGFVVRDALCRAADAWGSYLDRETPASGHPLGMIDDNPVTAQAPDAAGVLDDPAASGVLPAPDGRVAVRIAEELERFGDAVPGDAVFERLGDDTDPVELVESLLSADFVRQPALRLAWFLHLAARPAFRDGMMLQFAFGPVIGAAAHDDAIAAAERADMSGESLDDLVRREVAEGDHDDVTELLSRLLLGQSTLRPERARVEHALELLRPLIANAPEADRVGPLCIAAWLSWSLGRGSAAGAFIDRAVELEPAHPMAGLLAAFIGGGAIPEWAFVRPAAEAASVGAGRS